MDLKQLLHTDPAKLSHPAPPPTTGEASDDEPPARVPRQRESALERALRRAEEIKNDGAVAAHARAEQVHKQILCFRWILSVFGMLVVVAWQSVVLRLVWEQGWNYIHLPDSVLLAAVSTTSANVIGLLVIVFKFVFPSTSKDQPKSD